jgi:hypothetical protein
MSSYDDDAFAREVWAFADQHPDTITGTGELSDYFWGAVVANEGNLNAAYAMFRADIAQLYQEPEPERVITPDRGGDPLDSGALDGAIRSIREDVKAQKPYNPDLVDQAMSDLHDLANAGVVQDAERIAELNRLGAANAARPVYRAGDRNMTYDDWRRNHDVHDAEKIARHKAAGQQELAEMDRSRNRTRW